MPTATRNWPLPAPFISLISPLVALVIAGPAVGQDVPSALDPANLDPASLERGLERGAYVARAAGCMSCHQEDLSGGYEVETPMGTIVASNISPSVAYGIGGYSRDDLEGVLRRGVSPDRRLYPAMPYASFRGMTDEDIDALHLWLQAQDPVEQAPATQTALPFPFNIRTGVIAWNWLFLGDRDLPAVQPDMQANAPGQGVGQDAELARGAYIVNHLGHCSECHTPRNAFFGLKNDQHLQGEVIDGWLAPNLTPDRVTGLGTWRTQDIVDYLGNGQADNVVQAAGPMADFVRHSTSHLNEEDLTAMARYLQALPAVGAGMQDKPAIPPEAERVAQQHSYNQIRTEMTLALARDDLSAPERLYVTNCAACHGVTGQGQPQAYYPPLNQNAALRRTDTTNLLQVLLHGVEAGKIYRAPAMPGFGDELTHDEIAALANYTRTTFGGRSDSTLTAADVTQVATAKPEMPLLLRALQIAAWVGVIVLLAGLPLLVWWIIRRRKSTEQEA